MKRKYMLGVFAGAALSAACAGVPKPADQLINAQSAVRAADEVGADKVPQAELHAKLAREQIARANKLMEDGDNEEAARILVRAKADAELAIAMTRNADASEQLEKAQRNMSTSNGSASTANARNP